MLDRIPRAYGVDLVGYLEELALGAKASAPPGRPSTAALGPEEQQILRELEAMLLKLSQLRKRIVP